MKINKLFCIILIFLMFGCQIFKSSLYKGRKNFEYARMNAIIDFANTYNVPHRYLIKRVLDSLQVFEVNRRKDIENKQNYTISILPEIQKIKLMASDSLGTMPKRFFPTKYVIYDKKLFLWKDEKTPISKKILLIMDKYNILDSTNVKKGYNTITISNDDTIKAVDYYICKSNIKIYKKIKTNVAAGYYDPPHLNCK